MKRQSLTPKQRKVLEALRVPGQWTKGWGGLAEQYHANGWQMLNRATVRSLIVRGLLTVKKEMVSAQNGLLVLTEEGRAELDKLTAPAPVRTAPVRTAPVRTAPKRDERTERNLATLTPRAQAAARAFLADLEEFLPEGVTVRVISGTRTFAEQDALYAKGRTAPGPRVTNARGGFSNHNFGIAFDIGLFQGGAYLGASSYYEACGPIGERHGLEWGGRWKSFPDTPHYQLKTGLSLAEMRLRVAAGEEIA